MCTVHLQWLSEQSNKSSSNFALSLNIPLWKLFGWFWRLKLWATGDWQLHHTTHLLMHHISSRVFDKTTNHPGDSNLYHPRFSALQLLAFLKTKTTCEREKTSNHQWNSGKYDRAADGDWENYLRSQGVYFKGNWSIIVLCTMFLVSSSINVSILHTTWLDIFWTDLI